MGQKNKRIQSLHCNTKVGDYCFIKNDSEKNKFVADIYFLENGTKKLHSKKLYFSVEAFKTSITHFRNATNKALKNSTYTQVETIEPRANGNQVKVFGALTPENRTQENITNIMNFVVKEVNTHLQPENFIRFE